MRLKADIPVLGDQRIRDAFLFLPITLYTRNGDGKPIHSETRWWERAKWEEKYTFRDGIHQWEVLRFFDEEVKDEN